ncbi:MAG: Pyridoxamine 5'-phosphate oxidase-like FMN-binding protein [Acidobacteria bacterium]|nr:Pyridoxamine 5'-phosphate oxidase-like FMN-binding protein [Acidobacteriota bacterium]
MPDTPQWIGTFLQGRRYAVLATHNDDGSIHLTPVWYLFEDGQFLVGTSSTSRKARNISARPNASLVVDGRTLGSECWVSVSGSAQILGGEASRAINKRILQRYLTEEALQHSPIGPGLAATDDVTICLQPVKWRSWDLKSLDAQFFGGILAQSPQKWFLPLD